MKSQISSVTNKQYKLKIQNQHLNPKLKPKANELQQKSKKTQSQHPNLPPKNKIPKSSP